MKIASGSILAFVGGCILIMSKRIAVEILGGSDAAFLKVMREDSDAITNMTSNVQIAGLIALLPGAILLVLGIVAANRQSKE